MIGTGLHGRAGAHRPDAGPPGSLVERLAAVEQFLEASARHRVHLEEVLLGQQHLAGAQAGMNSAHGAAREMLLELGTPSRLARQAAELLDEELLEALNAADRAGMALCRAVRAARSAEELTAAWGHVHVLSLAEAQLRAFLHGWQPGGKPPSRAVNGLGALLRPSALRRVLQVR